MLSWCIHCQSDYDQESLVESLKRVAAQHGARLCENVLDDPLTGSN
jgi:hypothetical protein